MPIKSADMTKATKSCPFCGETVLAVAVKCKHCHSQIGSATVQSTSQARRSRFHAEATRKIEGNDVEQRIVAALQRLRWKFANPTPAHYVARRRMWGDSIEVSIASSGHVRATSTARAGIPSDLGRSKWNIEAFFAAVQGDRPLPPQPLGMKLWWTFALTLFVVAPAIPVGDFVVQEIRTRLSEHPANAVEQGRESSAARSNGTSQQNAAAGAVSSVDRSGCLATCQRLNNEEPRTATERELDAASYKAYIDCVNRERGGSGLVQNQYDATRLVSGMKACKDEGIQACLWVCAGAR